MNWDHLEYEESLPAGSEGWKPLVTKSIYREDWTGPRPADEGVVFA